MDQFTFILAFVKVFLMGYDSQIRTLWQFGRSGSGKTFNSVILTQIFDCEVLEKIRPEKVDPQFVIVYETAI